MLLTKMRDTAQAFIGLDKPIKQAVITVPAHFNDSQRHAIKDAATMADLQVLYFINAATAAAIT